MNLLRLLQIAIKSILKNRMRSFLTSLGIIIGVGSVIVMTGVGKGSQVRIQQQISSMGTNLIMIMNGQISVGGVRQGAGSVRSLTLEDADKLRTDGENILAVSPDVRSSGQAVGGNSNWSTSIEGVTPDYLTIKDWGLASGDMFTDKDIKSKRKVAVIGQTIVDELFQGVDPIGQKFRFRNTPFTVIGVLKEKGQSGMGDDQDDVILAPVTTVMSRLKGGTTVDMIYVSATTMDVIPQAQTSISSILRKQHKLNDGDDDDFRIRTQSEITAMATSTSKTLTLLLAAVASVSLIVGGIGIMNIMLVSVTERTKEIGLRMAIGARKHDILSQFLIEAVTLSLFGGLIGIGLAYGGSYIMNKFTELRSIISPSYVVLSVCFALVVGVFFGYYPARKASNLNPIDALRYE